MSARHLGERDVLRGARYPLNGARVLDREETFGNLDVLHAGQKKRADRDDERENLVIEHPLKRDIIAIDDALKAPFGDARNTAAGRLGMVTHDQRAHHWYKRERNDRRKYDRDRERDREFVKEPAHHVLHEEKRDEDRDQRDGERYDGEADLACSGQRRLQRRVAALDIARDIFDHHDRVVDDESARDRKRHEREIVEREAKHVHPGEGADE